MKINPVTSFYINKNGLHNHGIQNSYTDNGRTQNSQEEKVNDVYSDILRAYCLSFCAYANSSGLKRLFGYDIPCMYSGIVMIDASKIQKLLKNGHFSGGIGKITKALMPYEDSMMPIERELFEMLKVEAKKNPHKTFPKYIKELESEHLLKLRTTQAVTFYKLKDLSKEFPPEQLEKFSYLMQETDKKLQNVPVLVPFSTFEFKYKLKKMHDNLLENNRQKEAVAMKRIINIADKMDDGTDAKARQHQGHTLRQIKSVVEKSRLSNSKELRELLENSNNRIYNIPIKIPFNRKSFLYDFGKITDTLEDKELAKRVLETASELPTSRNNLSAFILKFQEASSERLCCRLVSDSYGSIEHLLPQSKGGKDELANYGPATTYFNSLRSNTDFVKHLKAHPEIKQHCQKSVDRMIELANDETFEKIKLPREYVLWFKNTVAELSNNELILNTDKLILKNS